MQVSVCLCRFKCVFMQSIMINRKLFGNFEFSCMLRKMSYLITLRFFHLLHIFEISRKRKQKQKNRIFRRFCPKTSVFVANKTLIFSDLCLYRVIYTPSPDFGTRRVGQLSSEIFYFFFIFCKIL